jgi:hypothetical protein
MANIGYDDTPFIPDSKWRVHDSQRPQPRIVTPGTESTLERTGEPPSDAVVLFDGTDGSGWEGRDSAIGWRVENGYMEVVGGTGNISSKTHFGDCQLHIEWATPSEVRGESQGRGNSGVFLMSAYEIQVLDCYENPTYADGTASAIYGQYPPLVNACRKPGAWQTYDIIFIAPKFEGETLVAEGYMTVFHNGVLVHHNRRLQGRTGHRNVPGHSPHPDTAPLMLQDHGDAVRFRNIWYRPLSLDSEA